MASNILLRNALISIYSANHHSRCDFFLTWEAWNTFLLSPPWFSILPTLYGICIFSAGLIRYQWLHNLNVANYIANHVWWLFISRAFHIQSFIIPHEKRGFYFHVKVHRFRLKPDCVDIGLLLAWAQSINRMKLNPQLLLLFGGILAKFLNYQTGITIQAEEFLQTLLLILVSCVDLF